MVGLVLAALANYLLSRHGIPLPEPIPYGGVAFDQLLGKVSVQSLLLPVLVVWGTAVVVSLLPALRAARLKPVEAMRMH